MQGVDLATHSASSSNSSWTASSEEIAFLTSEPSRLNMLFMQADPSDPFSAKHFTIQGLFDGAGWLAKALLTAQTSGIASPDVTVELEALIPKELSKNSVKGMSSTFNSYVNTLRFNETYLSDDELQTVSSSNASCGLVRNWLIRFNEKAIERLNCILRTVAEAEIISRTPLCDAQSGAPRANA